MSNGFFNDHPGFGSLFDFDHDGKMDLGEAAAMGAAGALYADLVLDPDGGRDHSSDGAGRPAEHGRETSGQSPFADDYDEGFIDNDDVDSTSRSSVMRALRSDDYWGDADELLRDALEDEVRFTPDDILELVGDKQIRSESLLRELVRTSKPEFTSMEKSILELRWGGPDFSL